MNDTPFLPDDPRLTAYALGELSGDERAAVEAALRRDPALRAAVADIRATVAQLQVALAEEAAAPAGEQEIPNGQARPQAVPPSRAVRAERSDPTGVRPRGRRGKLLVFPQGYYIAAGLAAACFAVAIALREKTPPPLARARVVSDRGPVVAVSAPEAVVASEPDAGRSRPVTPAVAPMAGTEPVPLVFVDRGLSLVEHTAPAPELPAPERNGAPRKGEEITLGERTLAASAGRAEKPAAAADADAAVSAAAGEAVALSPPAFVAPTPAPLTAPSIGVLGARAPRPTPTPATGATTPQGEVVLLQAFVVAEDRGSGGFAAMSGADASKRGGRRRSDLPQPPPGAKLGSNTEAYAFMPDNDFLAVRENRFSTFAVDVDTASYANVRRLIEQGTLPPRDAVRIEELLNYFPYRYAAPKGERPFEASLEVAAAPWAPRHRLVRIGLKAREVATADRPAANLVFLLDVSGSMDQPNKLPLVKQALRLLIGKLRADDRVAIVTYAGNSGLALPSTPVAQAREILQALDALTPGGSTNGAMGIHLAYDIAKANFAKDGINRVILCTDGDFNVGVTSEGELVRLIEAKAGSGVFLTVLGFGMGNYKDSTLEKLADKGNGHYGYIDTRREAEKLLVEQVNGTLVTVAKDVKIQVDFNPAKVASYRLIGYENRLLKKEDFNDDKIDAGEIGAGHTVTALYELVLVGAEDAPRAGPPPVDPSRYASAGATSSRLETAGSDREPPSNELLTVKVRYKKPDGLIAFGRTLLFPLTDAATPFAQASADFRFAAAVAEYGMILRHSVHRGTATLGDTIDWAAAASGAGDDPGGYRNEFIELVRKTQRLLP